MRSAGMVILFDRILGREMWWNEQIMYCGKTKQFSKWYRGKGC